MATNYGTRQVIIDLLMMISINDNRMMISAIDENKPLESRMLLASGSADPFVYLYDVGGLEASLCDPILLLSLFID